MPPWQGSCLLDDQRTLDAELFSLCRVLDAWTESEL